MYTQLGMMWPFTYGTPRLFVTHLSRNGTEAVHEARAAKRAGEAEGTQVGGAGVALEATPIHPRTWHPALQTPSQEHTARQGYNRS